MKPSCDTCAFAEHVTVRGGFAALECHRYPPTKVGVGDMIETGFPNVRADTWCAEHQPARGRNRATGS